MLTSLFLSLAIVSQLPAPQTDPYVDYETITTKHFHIHFDPAIRSVAEELVARAEPIYERITKLYQWEQWERTHVVLTDTEASANGFSVPIPYNLIYLYPVHPDENTALDQYDDWLTTLFTHEFTHSVHIDKATGLNQVLRYLFGRLIVPNAAQQQWAIEGLAIFEETKNTTRGRGRSWYQQMFLRSAALEDRFISIDRGTYWNDEYPFGNSAYWYGAGFYEYLAKIHGEDKIYQLVDATSDAIVPFFLNFTTDEVFGKSFHRMWEEWKLEERKKWNHFKSQSPTLQEGTALRAKDFRMTSRPQWSEDGTELLVTGTENERPYLFRFRQSESGSDWKVKREKLTFTSDFHLNRNRILFAKGGRVSTERVSRYNASTDLYLLNLKTEETERLTKGFRLKDPVLLGNRVVAVDTFRLKPRLVTFLIDEKRKEPITKDSDLEILFQGETLESIASPSLSPDGEKIVFSYRPRKKMNGLLRAQNRDLMLLDLKTKAVRNLTQSPEEEHEPIFSPSGDSIFFSASTSSWVPEVSISNLFEISLSDGAKPRAITQVLTGAFWPTPRPTPHLAPPSASSTHSKATEVAYGLYSADGLRLRLVQTKPLSPSSFSTRAPDHFSDLESKSEKEFSWADRKPIEPSSDPIPPSTEYRMGTSLIPRFLFPFFLYSDSETLVGAQTGSYDPLGIHSYALFGYHSFSPNRPGGGFSYRYTGLPEVTLFAGGFAGISNYGETLAEVGVCRTQAGTLVTDVCLVPGDYYERVYGGYLGLAHDLEGTDFDFSLQGFFIHRSPLLSFPTLNLPPDYLILGVTPVSQTLTAPQRGWQWGGRFTIRYASDFKSYPDSIAPTSGRFLAFTTEYTPEALGSEFASLTTVLNGRVYLETFKDVTIGTSVIAGLQWLDPLFQRAFRLGGAFGASQYSAAGYRSFPLRGLPSEALQGEGILALNLELRAPLLKSLPGLGTAPLWLKDLSFALFSDGGQTFQWKEKKTILEARLPNLRKKFAYDRFSLSTGGELRSQVSLTYAPPLTFRVGYGRTIFYRGENVFTESGFDEVYALLGTSF